MDQSKDNVAPKGSSDRLVVKNFAHIQEVSIDFGDLTILVGPQASGKSLILQMFKLVHDGRHIQKIFQKYGLVTRGDERRFLARYLGQGMEGSWREDSSISWRGHELSMRGLVKAKRRGDSSVYFVPAHRTLTLSEGYPPTFQQFKPDTPYVVRQFSEDLRQVLIQRIGQELLFPQAKRLKGKIRDKINEAIFHGAELREDATGVERQLKLRYDNANLAYMTWTAGQREFIPLLLGLYYLLPAGQKKKRSDIDWVVIEEPEMGLHPKAIMAIMLLMLDLLSRGYRVVLSTHSPLVLEVVWALNILKRRKGSWRSVLGLFDIRDANKANARGEVDMAEGALRKKYKVHLLEFKDGLHVVSRDISSLDPSSVEPEIAGWGGLTGMSERIGNVVSEAVSSDQG